MLKMLNVTIEQIAKLHPVAQVALFIGAAAIICVAIWQFWKTMREA